MAQGAAGGKRRGWKGLMCGHHGCLRLFATEMGLDRRLRRALPRRHGH